MEAIIHTKNELRPCMIKVYIGSGRQTKTEEKKAFFHKFITRAQPIAPSVVRGGHNGGQVVAPYALVELENGAVYEVETHDVRFLDTQDFMQMYDWTDRSKVETPQEDRTCENCKYFHLSFGAEPCCRCGAAVNDYAQWEARE